MLLSGSQLIGSPVVGLQTGSELASLETAIINPSDLTIVAYEVDGPMLDEHPSLLLISDIREMGEIGMIIDSSDEFVGVEDIIKLKPLYDLHFTVLDKQVIDDQHHKLGKVVDYNVEVESFVIQQLNVKRPLLKSFNDTELMIHRSQIIEINDTEIIVRSNTEPKVEAVTTDKQSYLNPFRGTTPQPEGTTTDPPHEVQP